MPWFLDLLSLLRIEDAAEAERFSEAWRGEQARFVDQPREAVARADRLVQNLVKARGYPVGDFEQRAADISVDHPRVVAHYRAAHEPAVRDASGQADHGRFAPSDEAARDKIHFGTADLVQQPSASGAKPSSDNGEPEHRSPPFEEAELTDSRQRWQNIPPDLVDDPRNAVRRADELVASLMKRLTGIFANERAKLDSRLDCPRRRASVELAMYEDMGGTTLCS